MQARRPAASILVDLDPASAERTVIVESIAADKQGRLYLPDRVTGNILRVYPPSPNPVVAVGRIESREIQTRKSMPILRGLPLINKAICLSPSVHSAKSCAFAEPS